MSGLDKNRKRNQITSFRVSVQEKRMIESKILVSAMSNGEYYRTMILNGKLSILVGRYESDRLSLEIKRMREYLSLRKGCDEIIEILEQTKALLETTNELMKNNAEK